MAKFVSNLHLRTQNNLKSVSDILSKNIYLFNFEQRTSFVSLDLKNHFARSPFSSFFSSALRIPTINFARSIFFTAQFNNQMHSVNALARPPDTRKKKKGRARPHYFYSRLIEGHCHQFSCPCMTFSGRLID